FSNKNLEIIGAEYPQNIRSPVTVLDAGSTSNWNIYNNTIVTSTSSYGIALHNVTNSNVLHNNISKNVRVPGNKYTSILLSNSSFNTVNCNSIDVISSISSKDHTGIFLLQSTFNKVECNSVKGIMDTHIFLEGDCNSTFLKGNNFYNYTLM